MIKSYIKPYIIGISGASCSGKSHVCDELVKKIVNCDESVTILNQDRYYKGGDINTNYDKPDAIDFTLLLAHLDKLCNWLPINAPIYDFTTHQCKKSTQLIQPNSIIIVEGIFVLYNEEIRKKLDLKIFVEAEQALCLARRLERDVKERGRDQQEVTDRYLRDVMPSNTIYINPTKCMADIILVNNVRDHFIGLEILNNHIFMKITQMKELNKKLELLDY